MYYVRVEIDGRQESVLQPVMTKVLKDVLFKALGDTKIPVRTSYRSTGITNKNWMMGSIKNRNLHKKHDKLVVCEYTEDFTESSVTTRYIRNDTIPLICDNEVEFIIRPTRVNTLNTLNITLLYKSKGELLNKLSRLRRIALTGRKTNYHKANYIFTLSKLGRDLILCIREQRENVTGVPETIEDYGFRIADRRLTSFSTQDGSEGFDVGFEERITAIVGTFEDGIENLNMDYDSSLGMWSSSFTYNYVYDTMDSLEVQYSGVIYNQLLPTRFRDFKAIDDEVSGMLPNGQASLYQYSEMVRGLVLNNLGTERQYVHIPDSDNHIEYSDSIKYIPIFSALCLLTTTNLKSLFNLGQLGDYALHTNLIDFITNCEYGFISTGEDSMIKMIVIDDYGNMLPIVPVVSNTLDVSVVDDLDINKTYRVLFSIRRSLEGLSDEAKLRTEECFTNFEEVIQLLTPNGLTTGLNNTVPSGYRDHWYFSIIVKLFGG